MHRKKECLQHFCSSAKIGLPCLFLFSSLIHSSLSCSFPLSLNPLNLTPFPSHKHNYTLSYCTSLLEHVILIRSIRTDYRGASFGREQAPAILPGIWFPHNWKSRSWKEFHWQHNPWLPEI